MLTYYLILPLLYLLAHIPTGALYRFSHLLSFILRDIAGYRRKVVMSNVRNSFPEKSEKEIQIIANNSYRHLSYRIIENIRCFAISKEEIDRRMVVKNPEILNEYYRQGRHVALAIGHIGPWEFGTYKLSLICKYKLYGIVSLVSNPYFNKLIQRTRGKMGMNLILMKDSKEFFQRQLPEPSLCAFISDQSPSNPERGHWTRFLNRDTVFFTGAERYAKLHNCVVMYPKMMLSEKEGYYTGEFVKITDAPNETAPGEITEKFVRLLEQQILDCPDDWLWSHKRWKHKKSQEPRNDNPA